MVAPCKALSKGNGDNSINTAAFFFLSPSIGFKFIGVLLERRDINRAYFCISVLLKSNGYFLWL